MQLFGLYNSVTQHVAAGLVALPGGRSGVTFFLMSSPGVTNCLLGDGSRS